MFPGAQRMCVLGYFSSSGFVGSQRMSIYTILLENAKLFPKVVGLIPTVYKSPLCHTFVTTWSCQTFEFYPTGMCISG